ncbi:MAG: RCC1 repeat- and reductase domain-containing protein, partial [Actinomycetota bacterium]
PGLTRVNAISAGDYTAFALRDDGTVWSWGLNNYGQVGVASTLLPYSSPVRVKGLSEVVAIAGGGNFGGLALRSDGTAWSWGNNMQGTLGNATRTPSGVPVQVYGLTAVTAIGAGTLDGYAIVGRAVWGWGRNDFAQLANATGADSDVPVRAGTLAGIVAAAGGAFNGYALRNDGSVFSWGDNGLGEIGNGTTSAAVATPTFALLPRIVAIAAGGTSAYAIEPVVPVV